MSIQASIQATQASAQRIFGDDIRMSVARCPAYGCDDCCILVYGAMHAAAARAFAVVMPDAKISEQQGGGYRGGARYVYSVVEFPAAAA